MEAYWKAKFLEYADGAFQLSRLIAPGEVNNAGTARVEFSNELQHALIGDIIDEVIGGEESFRPKIEPFVIKASSLTPPFFKVSAMAY